MSEQTDSRTNRLQNKPTPEQRRIRLEHYLPLILVATTFIASCAPQLVRVYTDDRTPAQKMIDGDTAEVIATYAHGENEECETDAEVRNLNEQNPYIEYFCNRGTFD